MRFCELKFVDLCFVLWLIFGIIFGSYIMINGMHKIDRMLIDSEIYTKEREEELKFNIQERCFYAIQRRCEANRIVCLEHDKRNNTVCYNDYNTCILKNLQKDCETEVA